MDIIKTVTDWPVIVQGALGSTLFWLILELGQRAVRRITGRLSLDKTTANWFALAAHEATGEVAEKARFFCLYGSLHYLIKALIIAVLAWMLSSFIDVVASVGYLISIYFLFRALAFVPHTKSFGSNAERKKKFTDNLAAIRAKIQTEVPAQVSETDHKNEP